MLRGNLQAKIDDKGRLKVPSVFLAFIQEKYGTDLFVTSLSGDCVWIYPMSVWQAKEEKLGAAPTTLAALNRYRDRVNYYGQEAELDKQGRVLIQPRLRDSAEMAGEVDVIGRYDHLEVWNHDRFVTTRLSEPFSDEDGRVAAEYGI